MSKNFEISLLRAPRSQLSAPAILFFIAIAASAFYVFPSGYPQPADCVLVASFGLLLVWSRFRIWGLRLLWPMIALTIWVAIVSLVWSILYPVGNFLRYALFFLFNLMVMFLSINIYRNGGSPYFFSRVAQAALIFSGVGVILTFIDPRFGVASEVARVSGFFNNPNQLAHFSLCMMGLLLLAEKGRMTYSWAQIAAYFSGLLGLLVSLSLGAWAGLLALLLAIISANGIGVAKVIRVGVAVAVVVGALFAFDVAKEGAISIRVEQRLDRLEDKISDIEFERGYYRIIAYPQFLLFGAGEGSNERFPSAGFQEVHSSLGNLLFSYGVIGLALFLALLWKALRYAPLHVWFIIAAPLVYSLTHMGLRTSAFWLLISITLCMYGSLGSSSRVRVRSGA